MASTKYVIFSSEQEAIDLSTELWDMVSSGNTTGRMFTVRPNELETRWAMIVDDSFNAELRVQRKIDKFNTKHSVNIKKGKKVIHDLIKNNFTMVNINSLDKAEWGL